MPDMTPDLAPEPIADYACDTGEGPLYHPDENRIYWTDIPAGKLFRYDVSTGEHEQCYSGEPVGGFTLQADGSLLLFCARGAVKVWRDGTESVVQEDIPDERETRFNDVFADPEGRVFCGTMPTHERKGRLYRLDPDGSLHMLLEGIGCSNGMGLTPDGTRLYYTDTGARHIYLYDYDRDSGNISNRQIFASAPEGEGFPDGMTVDADGNVWSARWDGNRAVCYAPDGSEVRQVHFPVRKVSSVTFGGPEYDTMYFTTAGGQIKERDGEHAGALFRLKIPGVRGIPEFRSRVGL